MAIDVIPQIAPLVDGQPRTRKELGLSLTGFKKAEKFLKAKGFRKTEQRGRPPQEYVLTKAGEKAVASSGE